jgi:hypothetical protein
MLPLLVKKSLARERFARTMDRLRSPISSARLRAAIAKISEGAGVQMVV